VTVRPNVNVMCLAYPEWCSLFGTLRWLTESATALLEGMPGSWLGALYSDNWSACSAESSRLHCTEWGEGGGTRQLAHCHTAAGSSIGI
jgi:hypothetical protein